MLRVALGYRQMLESSEKLVRVIFYQGTDKPIQ